MVMVGVVARHGGAACRHEHTRTRLACFHTYTLITHNHVCAHALQWAVSRPILNLVLLYHDEFRALEEQIVSSQLVEHRARLVGCFETLMDGVKVCFACRWVACVRVCLWCACACVCVCARLCVTVGSWSSLNCPWYLGCWRRCVSEGQGTQRNGDQEFTLFGLLVDS